jgi:hypothetical protein
MIVAWRVKDGFDACTKVKNDIKSLIADQRLISVVESADLYKKLCH